MILRMRLMWRVLRLSADALPELEDALSNMEAFYVPVAVPPPAPVTKSIRGVLKPPVMREPFTIDWND